MRLNTPAILFKLQLAWKQGLCNEMLQLRQVGKCHIPITQVPSRRRKIASIAASAANRRRRCIQSIELIYFQYTAPELAAKIMRSRGSGNRSVVSPMGLVNGRDPTSVSRHTETG